MQDEMCPIEKTMDIIGKKWTIFILRDLLKGPKRFSQLQRSLQGVSPKTLSDRLKELEKEEILTKTIFPVIPPHVEYTLTEKGKSLESILDEMKKWGKQWVKDC